LYWFSKEKTACLWYGTTIIRDENIEGVYPICSEFKCNPHTIRRDELIPLDVAYCNQYSDERAAHFCSALIGIDYMNVRKL